MRDGQAWRIGRYPDIAWIMDSTDEGGVKITCAIPRVFEAYWTLELPYSGDQGWRPQEVNRFAPDVVDVLSAHTPEQPWWLGYLRRGDYSNIIFDDAPQVALQRRLPHHRGWVRTGRGMAKRRPTSLPARTST
jgi:hypothetical protein